MSLQWVTTEIMRCRSQVMEPVSKHNPKPKGVMLEGSSTAIVMRWLKGRPSWVWWSRSSIRAGTGLTRGSVDWALIFLATTGRIDVQAHPGGHPRKTRYRAPAAVSRAPQ